MVGNVYKTDTSTYGNTGLKAYTVNTTPDAYGAMYWVASQSYYYDADDFFMFSLRYISGDSIGNSTIVLCSDGSYEAAPSGPRGFRPIITLNSAVKISGGSGTKASPYTLTK